MTTPTLLSRLVPWLALASFAPAQHDLANAFPPDSWAYVDLAGLDQQTQTFHSARLVGLMRQILGPEGAHNLEAMLHERGGPQLSEAQRALARLRLDAGQVRDVLAGGLALGVGRPTMMGSNMLPSMALIAAVGDGKAARAISTAAEQILAHQAPNLARSAQTIAGAEFVRLDLPRAQGQVLYGFHRGYYLLSNSPGYLADCMAAISGQAPSLAQNAGLARSRAKLRGTSMASLFVNAQQFGAGIAPLLPYEADAIGKALGISGLPNLFVGFGHDGKSSCDLFELALPGATDGLLKALLHKPVTNRAAQWVKPSTAFYVSASLDTDAMKTACQRLLEYLPAAAKNQFERQLQRQLGGPNGQALAHIGKIAAVLGNEISLAFDMPQPLPPFVTFTAFVEVRDVAAAEQMLRQLADSGRVGDVEFEEVDGAKVWSTAVRTRALNISPTCALRDGWLVISNFKSVVKRHLRNGALGDDSLAADPRFKAAVQSAPHAAFFATGRVDTALQAYWGLAATGIRTGTSQLGFEPDDMPNADEVSDAVDDIVIAGSATADGFTLRVQQPFGLGTMLPACGSALDWLLAAIAGKPADGSGPMVKKIY